MLEPVERYWGGGGGDGMYEKRKGCVYHGILDEEVALTLRATWKCMEKGC